MKYFSLAILFLLISCGKKEMVLLPKSNVTIVKEMTDYSPIYIFFKVNGKDTLAAVNRKNTISTTNWIFHIDKRLPLRLVIPEIVKLQHKKKNGTHENPSAGNYYSYADSLGMNLAFLPFTNVNYKMMKPKTNVVFFARNGKCKIDNQYIDESELRKYFKTNSYVVFGFDKNMSYGIYIQAKVLIADLKNKNAGLEFSNTEYCF